MPAGFGITGADGEAVVYVGATVSLRPRAPGGQYAGRAVLEVTGTEPGRGRGRGRGKKQG